MPDHKIHVSGAVLRLPESVQADREVVERLNLSGPMSARPQLLNELQNLRFRIVHSGPYTDSDLWPKVDAERFQLVVERILD